MSEVTRHAAQRDHQVIVTKHLLLALHPLLAEVDALHLIHHHFKPRHTGKDRADRLRNIRRRKPSHRHLIKERLKQMMIGAIHERYTGAGMRELLAKRQPAKARPQHKHPFGSTSHKTNLGTDSQNSHSQSSARSSRDLRLQNTVDSTSASGLPCAYSNHMAERLTVQQPKQANELTAFLVALPIVLVGVWFYLLHKKEQDVHFEAGWLNLAVHAAFILVPIVVSIVMLVRPLAFAPTDEALLCYSSYPKTFRASWWMLMPIWPPGLFAAFVLLRDLVTEYAPHPDTLATSPPRALLIIAVTFVVSFLYSNMIVDRFGLRVSAAGIRTSMVRFIEWQKFHHVTADGNIYGLYLNPKPAFPFTFIPVDDDESKALLQRLLSQHNIPTLNSGGAPLTAIKLASVAVCLLNLALCFWLRFGLHLGLMPIIGISFVVGTIANIALDRIRCVEMLPNNMPIVEPPAL
jgi:hypothetical protein